MDFKTEVVPALLGANLSVFSLIHLGLRKLI